MSLKDKVANALYHRAYWKKYYANPENKIQHKLNEKKREKNLREKINAYKIERGCIDCGFNTYACALDFDHMDPAIKSFSIASVTGRRWSWGKVLKEIAKCEIRCSNCHRIRHYLALVSS